MRGIVENMPPAAREDRLREIAAAIVGVVSGSEGMTLSAALNETASQNHIAVSQVKHGMNYALSRGYLRLDGLDRLTVGTA